MATNLVYKEPSLSVVVTHPTTPTSGMPVRFGTLTGVALTDEGDGGNEATETSVDFTPGKTWDLSVDDNAGTGIAVGAKVYYHDTGTGTPATSLNNSSVAADAFFGYALEVVAANATTTIQVMHSLEQV